MRLSAAQDSCTARSHEPEPSVRTPSEERAAPPGRGAPGEPRGGQGSCDAPLPPAAAVPARAPRGSPFRVAADAGRTRSPSSVPSRRVAALLARVPPLDHAVFACPSGYRKAKPGFGRPCKSPFGRAEGAPRGFAPHLVAFEDHGEGQTMSLDGGPSFVRDRDGAWHEVGGPTEAGGVLNPGGGVPRVVSDPFGRIRRWLRHRRQERPRSM